MSYRTISVRFKPSSSQQWKTFSASRQEAARLWNDLVELHFRIRRRRLQWPSKGRLQKWAKGKYRGLYSQSVQQAIGEFCEAVNSAREIRKQDARAKYPWKKARFRNITYTNQSVKLQERNLILPNGASGKLKIRLPEEFMLPGRLIEVRLSFDTVYFICLIEDESKPTGPSIGVDLGVNTLLAATDGTTAVLISGRQVKSITQGRNKFLAKFSALQSCRTKGSRRWKKLQRRKRRMLEKARRRINDVCHKATRQIANAFPNAKIYVGHPFNDAAQRINSRQAQLVSQACNARLIFMLDYKTAGAIKIDESYSSQTCPVCGGRKKCRRLYVCSCGVRAPRDVVGALNIRSLGVHGKIQPCKIPNMIKYLRPLGRSSSGGHPASSSTYR
jgi:putative transposase